MVQGEGEKRQAGLEEMNIEAYVDSLGYGDQRASIVVPSEPPNPTRRVPRFIHQTAVFLPRGQRRGAATEGRSRNGKQRIKEESLLIQSTVQERNGKNHLFTGKKKN